MFANLATAVTSGTLMTMALFYVMNMLITIQPDAITDARDYHILKFVRVPPPEDPPDTIKPPIVRKNLEAPVPPASSAPVDQEGFKINITPRSAPLPENKYAGPTTVMSDGPLVAIVRVEPTYPARPLQQGLEGFVIVQFDVLEDGTVSNVSIVESSSRLFETAATRAAMRFRFKPRVVGGVALATTGVQNLFRFELEH